MFLLKKLLSAWLLPPLGLLPLALVALLLGWRRRSGQIVASLAILATLAMSLPIVAEGLSRSIETALPVDATALRGAQAIVILGGGVHYGAPEYGGDTLSKYSLERARYGAKLARESKLPALVTGGSVYGGRPEGIVMKQVLEQEFAVPVRWVENESRDTAENASYSAVLLKRSGILRIALVTHAWHMSRAEDAFRRHGFTVIPAPTGFTPRRVSRFESLLPSSAALERSAMVVRERVGLLVARLH